MGGTRQGVLIFGLAPAILLVALLLAPPAAAAPVPLDQAGSAGSGPGQLSFPEGVAVDADGNVYVSDFSNNRIVVFGPDGTFLKAFGADVALPNGGTAFEVCTAATGCQAGEAGGNAGQLDSPYGIDLNSSGRLIVSDSNNNRISVFDTNPLSFIYAIGWDVAPPGTDDQLEVCNIPSGCLPGDPGSAAGQLSSPAGIAAGPLERVYVADLGNSRISVFELGAQNFVHAFGGGVATGANGFEVCTATCMAGAFDDEAGELAQPVGLTVDASGNLYVPEFGNDRISVFNTAGPTFTRAFGFGVETGLSNFEICDAGGGCQAGLVGGAAGQLRNPIGVALDSSGDLYVGDEANARISVFDPSGPSFLRALGFGVDSGTAAFQVCTASSLCQAGLAGSSTGQLSEPRFVASDCAGSVWVGEAGNHRIQRFGEPGTRPAPGCSPAAAPPRCAGRATTSSGTAGNDVISGTGGPDVIAGLGGRDRIRGLGGRDLLCGGAGRDRLSGGVGRDRLLGQAGRDVLRGGPGRDALRGGPGRDVERQ